VIRHLNKEDLQSLLTELKDNELIVLGCTVSSREIEDITYPIYKIILIEVQVLLAKYNSYDQAAIQSTHSPIGRLS